MYKLTELAADDFAGIYDYTQLRFGVAQADLYTSALEAFIETLAEMPDMGRNCSAVPDVIRIEFQWHTLFYTLQNDSILIVRILHQQMNHSQHLA